jgi:PiT family inorganic phosphate transporter
LGIPSSSSHALIGGMIGAAMLKTGPAALMGTGIAKTLVFILVAPLLGFVLSSLIVVATAWLLRGTTPRRVDRWFRRLQLLSSGLYSLGHGANDAQKTMGIIWLLLISANLTSRDHLPSWVIWSAYLAIGLGTLFGGWRIVKTMGQGITRLKPVGGFAAETGGAMSLFIASGFGIPVSTTHTITGSIVGVGAADRMSAVRWAVAGRIVWAWIITIPASGMLAAVAYLAGSKFL